MLDHIFVILFLEWWKFNQAFKEQRKKLKQFIKYGTVTLLERRTKFSPSFLMGNVRETEKITRP